MLFVYRYIHNVLQYVHKHFVQLISSLSMCVTVNMLSPLLDGEFQYDVRDQVNYTHMHLCSPVLNN